MTITSGIHAGVWERKGGTGLGEFVGVSTVSTEKIIASLYRRGGEREEKNKDNIYLEPNRAPGQVSHRIYPGVYTSATQ